MTPDTSDEHCLNVAARLFPGVPLRMSIKPGAQLVKQAGTTVTRQGFYAAIISPAARGVGSTVSDSLDQGRPEEIHMEAFGTTETDAVDRLLADLTEAISRTTG